MKKITVGHSPDADDAFMFYALANRLVPTGEFEFVHELHDIETLNQYARRGVFDVTAVSIHAYAHLHRHYALMPYGASMGEGYGPIAIARDPLSVADLETVKVAVPGWWTSAYLALKLAVPKVQCEVVPFDKIIPAVQLGQYQAGVIIHEGQLTYSTHNLHSVMDLGVWWGEETGLPLPLGGNVVRKDLDPATIQTVTKALLASVQYGLAHRQAALDYAHPFAEGLDRERTDRFVGMYVNHYTLDYGNAGRQAVARLLEEGFRKNIIPELVTPEFVVVEDHIEPTTEHHA